MHDRLVMLKYTVEAGNAPIAGEADDAHSTGEFFYLLITTASQMLTSGNTAVNVRGGNIH